MVFTAGIIGWDESGTLVAPDLAGQLRQILFNTVAILAEDGAGPEHVVRMTWYVVDIDEYRLGLAEIGAAYKEVMGRNFPAMAVVEVGALVEPGARIEIETTAVVPKW
jgi:enamine deaminase RidA (YjgF/YER057c/UK114 family)